MKKYLIALLIGIAALVFFGVLAGFGAGACHCSTPVRVLFPFMSLLGSNAGEGMAADLLLGLQWPVYALSVAMPKSTEWRAAVFAVVVVVHLCAAAAASQMPGR
jgi:hypothetical protein